MNILDALVAKILTDTKIAINVGDSAGVQEGNTVVLYDLVEINDPDTKEPLGTVELEKGRMVISEVQPNLSVARVPYNSGILAGVTFGGSPRFTISDGKDRTSVSLRVGERVKILLPDWE